MNILRSVVVGSRIPRRWDLPQIQLVRPSVFNSSPLLLVASCSSLLQRRQLFQSSLLSLGRCHVPSFGRHALSPIHPLLLKNFPLHSPPVGRSYSMHQANSEESLVVEAHSLVEEGHFNDALELLSECLETNPDHYDAITLKAYTLEKLGKLEEALHYYNQSVSIRPNNLNVNFNKANCLIGLSRYDEAIEVFDLCLRLDPQHIASFINKGAILQTLDRNEEAINCYQQTLSINPSDSFALSNIGLVQYKLKNYHEAIEWFNKALQVSPEDFVAWFNRGRAYEALEDWKEALHCYKRVASLNLKLEGLLERLATVGRKLDESRRSSKE